MGGLLISEVGQSRKSWYADGWLRLPQTKNGRAHSIPLTRHAEHQHAPLMEIMSLASPYIIPNSKNSQRPTPFGSLNAATRRIVEAYGLERYQLRDLCRTFKTYLLESGFVREREIDLWHNHGRHADVARKFGDWAEYRDVKLRVAQAIDTFLDQVLSLDAPVLERGAQRQSSKNPHG